MTPPPVIGIDLGGTNLRGGIVKDGQLTSLHSRKINAKGNAEEVRDELFAFADSLITPEIKAIGIGVPGLVNRPERMVYDVVYIPAWKKVPLEQWMEDRYQIPVLINNDANCFALGEYYFGKGQGQPSMIGVTLGTGLGTGLILQHKLYEGQSGGAGEFGMVDYLDQTIEYYSSGQFFQNVYQMDGETVFQNAKKGDPDALRMYGELGIHFGKAVKTMLYALDVELIVIGGSVRYGYPYFSKTMWEQIHTFGFQKAIQNLKIEVSELENAGILGAAALYFDSLA
ncbi:MAG: ROK family protein [Bacteroidota bacterium]|nr:ROK family protein [Bacteroidota bacterium]